MAIEHHTGIGKTGVVGVIRGERQDSGRAVGLRADMDALPMHEENDFAHVSRFKGRMHGCGHDGHTDDAARRGALPVPRRARFDGTVYLIFQPGEEGFGGGKAMVDDGLFERFPADEIYALHNWPALPPGKIGVRPGPMMAAADRIEIHIEGRGGHGAHPHLTIDPVLVAGHIITAAQSIVVAQREPDRHRGGQPVRDARRQHGGDERDSARGPTGRHGAHLPADDAGSRSSSARPSSVHSIAAAFGATATLKYERVYPATINSDLRGRLCGRRRRHAGRRRERRARPRADRWDRRISRSCCSSGPAPTRAWGRAAPRAAVFCTTARYDFNDEVIPLGAGYLAALAEAAMPISR